MKERERSVGLLKSSISLARSMLSALNLTAFEEQNLPTRLSRQHQSKVAELIKNSAFLHNLTTPPEAEAVKARSTN